MTKVVLFRRPWLDPDHPEVCLVLGVNRVETVEFFFLHAPPSETKRVKPPNYGITSVSDKRSMLLLELVRLEIILLFYVQPA